MTWAGLRVTSISRADTSEVHLVFTVCTRGRARQLLLYRIFDQYSKGTKGSLFQNFVDVLKNPLPPPLDLLCCHLCFPDNSFFLPLKGFCFNFTI